MLGHTANVHVVGSTRRPFKYCATFVWNEPATRLSPPPTAYLYAEGDLAAFLEDCGADLSEIAALLDGLEAAPDANISVAPKDDLPSALRGIKPEPALGAGDSIARSASFGTEGGKTCL